MQKGRICRREDRLSGRVGDGLAELSAPDLEIASRNVAVSWGSLLSVEFAVAVSPPKSNGSLGNTGLCIESTSALSLCAFFDAQ